MRCRLTGWAWAGLAGTLVSPPAMAPEGPCQLDFLETATTRQIGANNWLAGSSAMLPSFYVSPLGGLQVGLGLGLRLAGDGPARYAQANAIWQFQEAP